MSQFLNIILDLKHLSPCKLLKMVRYGTAVNIMPDRDWNNCEDRQTCWRDWQDCLGFFSREKKEGRKDYYGRYDVHLSDDIDRQTVSQRREVSGLEFCVIGHSPQVYMQRHIVDHIESFPWLFCIDAACRSTISYADSFSFYLSLLGRGHMPWT